jgi:hypothetical protein
VRRSTTPTKAPTSTKKSASPTRTSTKSK